MTPHAQYYLQILEKIGAPLMRAVIAQNSSEGDAALQEQAKTLAALLSRTVQVSIGMSQSFDFAKNAAAVGSDDDGDTLRVALAALAGPLVADQYNKMGRLPADQDLQRLTSALDSVLTFSENFSPDVKEAAERLESITPSNDDTQRSLHYIGAFLPVIDAVSRFSFGQNEKKLVLDISEKLVKRAMDMRESVFQSVQGENDQKSAEVRILTTLGQIYAACHDAQITALSAGDDGGAAQADPDTALATLWKNFEIRCEMIEAVMLGLGLGQAPSDSAQGAGQGAPPAPPAAQPASQPPPQDVTPQPPAQDTAAAPPQDTPVKPAIFGAPTAPQDPPPAVPTSEQPPASADPETPPPAAGNPMAMFAKPKTQTSEDAPESAPEAAPSQESPPETSPAAPADSPLPQETEKPQGGAQGGPMSFFKPKDEDQSDNEGDA